MVYTFLTGEGGEAGADLSGNQQEDTRKWNEVAPREVPIGVQDKVLHPEHGLSLELGGTGFAGRAHDARPVQVQGASVQGICLLV